MTTKFYQQWEVLDRDGYIEGYFILWMVYLIITIPLLMVAKYP